MFFKAGRKSALAVVLALCIMFIAVPVFAQGGNETAAKVDMTKDADGIAWRQFAGTELHLGMNKHVYTDTIRLVIDEFEEKTGIKVIIEDFPQRLTPVKTLISSHS